MAVTDCGRERPELGAPALGQLEDPLERRRPVGLELAERADGERKQRGGLESSLDLHVARVPALAHLEERGSGLACSGHGACVVHLEMGGEGADVDQRVPETGLVEVEEHDPRLRDEHLVVVEVTVNRYGLRLGGGEGGRDPGREALGTAREVRSQRRERAGGGEEIDILADRRRAELVEPGAVQAGERIGDGLQPGEVVRLPAQIAESCPPRLRVDEHRELRGVDQRLGSRNACTNQGPSGGKPCRPELICIELRVESLAGNVAKVEAEECLASGLVADKGDSRLPHLAAQLVRHGAGEQPPELPRGGDPDERGEPHIDRIELDDPGELGEVDDVACDRQGVAADGAVVEAAQRRAGRHPIGGAVGEEARVAGRLVPLAVCAVDKNEVVLDQTARPPLVADIARAAHLDRECGRVGTQAALEQRREGLRLQGDVQSRQRRVRRRQRDGPLAHLERTLRLRSPASAGEEAPECWIS